MNWTTLLFRPWATSRLARIRALEPELRSVDDAELRARSTALRRRARTGIKPRRLMTEAFALVREASRRAEGLNLRHHDVQILGGIALCTCGLAEMQTGEGKTLTAALPVYLFALYGRGAHLATANDYLARRDAESIGRIYRLLGLTVGVVNTDTAPDDRRQAYACDVTYGTAKEFGFDFLRDRLASRAGGSRNGAASTQSAASAKAKLLQRDPFFMLVDEADSILIDDAGTPLVIAGAAGRATELETARYRWAAAAVEKLQQTEHYELLLREQRVELTPSGRQAVRGLPQSPELSGVGWSVIYEDVERAVLTSRIYLKQRQYVVRDGEAHIVDEFTGRIAEGRKWRRGIHQAVEAQEGLEITDDGGQAARVTVQSFFRRYKYLCGMTGTVAASAAEFRRIYRVRTVVVPTHKPCIRRMLPTRVFGTAAAKLDAIVAEIVEFHKLGRPLLVGTRSIEQSDRLSQRLQEENIDHQVLNARFERQEAEIIAQAGERGRVTVATNMAGRGTDIRLGPGAAEVGGLHVILTEMHDAARIDRQLIGRCARQGDPGTARIFVSLEDELLRNGLGAAAAQSLAAWGRTLPPTPISGAIGRFRRAQRKVETLQFRRRKNLLQHEEKRTESARMLGLDPHLDLPD